MSQMTIDIELFIVWVFFADVLCSSSFSSSYDMYVLLFGRLPSNN